MTGLVSVADGLYAQPDYSFLPPTVAAWAGYVGKASINAWTRDQVAALEATGRLWLPVWTPGDGVDYTRADATADAASMLAGLAALGITDRRWVFLDIERSREVNDVAQAEDAAAYWCTLMRGAGWPRAGWYGPKGSTATWVADWTGVPPVMLPPGVLGVQYDHALAGDRYDISRFDPSVLDKGAPVSSPADIAKAVWSQPIPYGPSGVVIAAGDRLAEIDHHAGVDLVTLIDDLSAQIAALQQSVNLLGADVAKLSTGSGPLQYHGTVSLTAGP